MRNIMVGLAIVSLAVGCEDAAKNCRDIRIAEIVADADQYRVRSGADRWERQRAAGTITDAQYLDSTKTVPPPTPSDAAWYAEHCWEGEPR